MDNKHKSSNYPRVYTNIFNIIDVGAISAFLFLFLIGIYLISSYNSHVWVDLIFDDAYYYLGIARNITSGLGSSFLPPFHTNGYQPLWLLILVLTSHVFGTSEHSLVLQIYCLSFIFVFLFAFLSKKHYGYFFPAIALSLTFPAVGLYGMETTLLPPLFILFFSSRNWTAKGIFSSLIFLARLDALALVIAHDIYVSVRDRKNNFKHYLIVIPLAVFYCLTNYYLFDVFVPVSGLAKSVGNIRGENIYPFLQYLSSGLWPIIFFIPILCIILFGRKRYPFRYKDEIISSFLAILICATYYSINSGWQLWGWYFWPVLMLVFYCCAEIINFFFFKISKLSPEKNIPALNKSDENLVSPNDYAIGFRKKWLGQDIKNILLLLLVVITFSRIFLPSTEFLAGRMNLIFEPKNDYMSYGKRNVELVDYLKKNNIPNNTFFAMGDRAGSFGFFMGPDFRFLQTEGLVASADYYRSMANDNGLGFIENLPIDYFIAERENYLEQDDVIGVVEPALPLSSHFGQWLICFNHSDILMDQSYYHEKRYVFNFKKRIPCPTNLANHYLEARATYGGIRKFSFPEEYVGNGLLQSLLNLQRTNIPPF